jgi:hypothetical protein
LDAEIVVKGKLGDWFSPGLFVLSLIVYGSWYVKDWNTECSVLNQINSDTATCTWSTRKERQGDSNIQHDTTKYSQQNEP